MFIENQILKRRFQGNIDATIVMQGQRIQKDNETYFNVQDFFVDFDIGHAYIQLDNLFNGDEELGRIPKLICCTV